MKFSENYNNKEYMRIEYLQEMTANTKYGKLKKLFCGSNLDTLNKEISEYIGIYEKLLDLKNIELDKIIIKRSNVKYEILEIREV